MLFCILGASGSGKSVLLDIVLEMCDIKNPVSHTSRKKRDGEVDGVHYHFVTEPEFEKMNIAGKMAEYTVYGENYYGLSEKEIMTGGHKIVIVERHGYEQLLKHFGRDGLRLIYVKAGPIARARRMVRDRARNPETIVSDLNAVTKRIEIDMDHFDGIEEKYHPHMVIDNEKDGSTELFASAMDLIEFLLRDGVAMYPEKNPRHIHDYITERVNKYEA